MRFCKLAAKVNRNSLNFPMGGLWEIKSKWDKGIKDSNERGQLDSCVCQLKGGGGIGRGDNTRGKSLLIEMGGGGSGWLTYSA